MIEIEKIEADFIKLISERLLNDDFPVERSFTYTFFYLLVKNCGYQPHELLLEHPHLPIKKTKKTKVDTYIKNGIIMECKYDRKPKTFSDTTGKSGRIFKDLFRLASFEDNTKARRWFIYITDNEMKDHLKNKFNDFFDLEKNKELEINDEYLKKKDLASTFIKELLGKKKIKDVPEGPIMDSIRKIYGIGDIKIKCILKNENLPNEHKIRIYEVIV